MDALRKAFQRAVQAPLNSVEMIWQDYNAFENNLSKMTVRSSLSLSAPPRHAADAPSASPPGRSLFHRPRSSSQSSHPPT